MSGADPAGLHPLLQQAMADYAQGKHADAEAKIRTLLAQRPDDPVALHQLAYTLTARGQAERDPALQEAGLAAARRACELAPDLTAFRESLLRMLGMLRRPGEMLEVAEAWYRRDPTDMGAVWAYSAALQECLRFDDARRIYAEGAAMCPDDAAFLGNRASFSNYDDGVTAAERAALHRAAGDAYARAGAPLPKYSNTPDPARKLRVGLISPDFRNHSCASFLEPLLANLDKSAFDLYLYYTMNVRDEATDRFRALAKGFRQLAPQPGAGEGLGFKLWNDRIDVLIDLAGHTAGHRLNVMQGRPVPVQATYLGYPNTTGLSTIHFRLVDSITDPPGSEPLASETLLRLDPCFLCYKPHPAAPAIEPAPPAARPGAPGVTFGSFNNANKTSPTTIRLWAAAMREVPGSTILLKSGSFSDPVIHAAVLDRFAAAGITPDRIRFEGATPDPIQHLARYNAVDVALDSTPYNGTTTTCEGLWMGVPVVTLLGDSHAGRVSASLLTAVGLPDLIARDEAAFASTAAALARDHARLASLRTTLRPTMAASPLGDAPAAAARFGAALRQMWASWCASAAPGR